MVFWNSRGGDLKISSQSITVNKKIYARPTPALSLLNATAPPCYQLPISTKLTRLTLLLRFDTLNEGFKRRILVFVSD